MQLTENTILITGGGSGIGRGLAEQFHALGNQVIIAGRRQKVLNEVTAANPGMKSVILDIADPASIGALAAKIATDFPRLNVLINNAGIMKAEKLQAHQEQIGIADQIVAINLLGPIRLTAALLPLLQKQPKSTVMTVTSGLAYVPLAPTPTYCATKAALHSYSLSQRFQLRATKVKVLELAPPYVQTELMGSQQAGDPRAMPLKDFIAEVMSILKTQPNATEIAVERVKPLRFATESGKFDAVFNGLNEAMKDRQ